MRESFWTAARIVFVAVLAGLSGCASTSTALRTPDETDVPSVSSGWALVARRSASATPYDAPIPGGSGIYVFRARKEAGWEISVRSPGGAIIEIERLWRSVDTAAGELPSWRAYSNSDGLLLVFFASTAKEYRETRVLLLADAVKSVRFLSHDGADLSDEVISY